MEDDLLIKPGFIKGFFCKHGDYPIRTISDFKSDENLGKQVGVPTYIANTAPEYRDFLLAIIRGEESVIDFSIVIDAETLHDKEIMDAIKEKANGNPLYVRIADEGYTLTLEDYEILKDVTMIFVDNMDPSVEAIDTDYLVIPNEGPFKRSYEVVYPVDLERTREDESKIKMVFHVTKELTDEEIDQLIDAINSDPGDVELDLNLYDPKLYGPLFEKLKEKGLRKDADILLLSDTLIDHSSDFEELQTILPDNKVYVIYSTCHDMIDDYQKEPFGSSVQHYSSIEGGGKTTLSNYLNILRFLDESEKHIKEMGYSPLEAMVWAHDHIATEYVYSPEEEINRDISSTQSLSHIINEDEKNGHHAICLGLATLYSAMLRKAGIPVFRYTVDGHARNIARVKDPKYGVDQIVCCDVTWDLPDEKRYHKGIKYNYFGFSPRDGASLDDKFFSLPLSLVTTPEEADRVRVYSMNPYEAYFLPLFYDPRGYAIRTLQLMGYTDAESIKTIDDYYSLVMDLNENGMVDGIDLLTILDAKLKVEREENPSITEEEIKEIKDRFLETIANRQEIFALDPHVSFYDGKDWYYEPIHLIDEQDIEEWRNNHPEHVLIVDGKEEALPVDEIIKNTMNSDGTYSFDRSHIIQDNIQEYNATPMTDEEIEEARRRIAETDPKVTNNEDLDKLEEELTNYGKDKTEPVDLDELDILEEDILNFGRDYVPKHAKDDEVQEETESYVPKHAKEGEVQEEDKSYIPKHAEKEDQVETESYVPKHAKDDEVQEETESYVPKHAEKEEQDESKSNQLEEPKKIGLGIVGKNENSFKLNYMDALRCISLMKNLDSEKSSDQAIGLWQDAIMTLASHFGNRKRDKEPVDESKLNWFNKAEYDAGKYGRMIVTGIYDDIPREEAIQKFLESIYTLGHVYDSPDVDFVQKDSLEQEIKAVIGKYDDRKKQAFKIEDEVIRNIIFEEIDRECEDELLVYHDGKPLNEPSIEEEPEEEITPLSKEFSELKEYLELSHLRSVEDENRKESALSDEQRRRLFELTLLENERIDRVELAYRKKMAGWMNEAQYLEERFKEINALKDEIQNVKSQDKVMIRK